MNKQNSEGSSSSHLHPYAIVQHGIEVKKDIQNGIFELIAILKKREHDLCLEVDQKCFELLYEAEESEMRDAPVLNHKVEEDKQYVEKQDLLTSKLKFIEDSKFCKSSLINYGTLLKVNCRKNAVCNTKTYDQQPKVKEVDGLASKTQLAACTSPESILGAQLSDKSPSCSSSANQTCTNRIKKGNEWLADAAKYPEIPIDEEIKVSSCDTLSEFSVLSNSCSGSQVEMASGDSPHVTIKACFSAYLQQDDLEQWLSSGKSVSNVEFFERFFDDASYLSAQKDLDICSC